MYKFYLNIGSLSSPVSDGGWVEIYPLYEDNGLKKTVKDDEIFGRVEYSGDLKLYGDEYTAITTLMNTTDRAGFKIELSGNTIIEGYILLFGKFNEDEKICELSVNSYDNYSNIIDNIDKEINIIESFPVYKCRVYNQVFLEYATETVSNFIITGNGDNIDSGTPDYIPVNDALVGGATRPADHWKCYTSEYTRTQSFPVRWFDVTTVWVREYSYKKRIGDVKNPEPASEGWYYDSTITFPDGSKYDKYVRIPYNNAYTTYTRNDNWPVYRKYTLQLPTDQYIEYSRGRKLQDVIQYMVEVLDSSILFDDNSFNYLENNITLKNIILIEISDFIPSTITGLEKEEKAEIGNITFKELFQFMAEVWNIYYVLEDIGGNYYFRLKHRSEINYAVGVGDIYDLTNYKGEDWSKGKNKYSYKDKYIYHRKKRNIQAGNQDFVGEDILVTNLESTGITQEINIDKFLFDVWDILENPTNYSNSSGQFVMMNCDYGFASNLATNIPGPPISIPFITEQSGFNLNFSWNDTTKTITAKTNVYTNSAISKLMVSSEYSVLNITCNVQIISGNAPTLEFVFVDASPVHTFTSGANNIIQFKNNDEDYRIKINLSGTGEFIITSFSVVEVRYTVRNIEGALSGQSFANAELSIANIDETHGKYDLPSKYVNINGTARTLTSSNIAKYKQIEEINFPCQNPDEIDFTNLIKTGAGDFEPKELQIFFNKNFAKIKGDI